MIQLNGFNCWSPLHPMSYVFMTESNVPTGIAGIYADMATGSTYLKGQGFVACTEAQGMAVWNLMWLLTPQFDSLPAICAAKDIDNLPLPKETQEESASIFTFSKNWEKGLLGDPVVFVNQVRGAKSALPVSIPMPELSLRAQASRSSTILSVVKDTESNVIAVNFRR